MKNKALWLALAGMLAAMPMQAKKYLIQEGVKYHIGDNKYSQSEDSKFVGTYPVVGPLWTQAFKVDRKDRVKVTIEHIWGVDDCPYCKIIVSIDEWDMGRLYSENNHTAFNTPTELAKEVEPGKIYILKIASLGKEEVDDFVVENVIVETDAEVTFIEKPKIGPVRKAAGACDSPRPNLGWLYNGDDGKPAKFTLASETADFSGSSPVARVNMGESMQFGFKVSKAARQGDKVSQPLEILLGEAQKSGWALSFTPGRDRVDHGNILLADQYRAAEFKPNYLSGRWNWVKVIYCTDGSARLYMNGVEMSQDVWRFQGEVPITVRLMGLEADFSKTGQ